MKFEIHCCDCMDWTRRQPDDSVDLVLCSPPYEQARLYGELGFRLKGQQWVDWAVERFLDQYRICKGLVCWVVEGQTRAFRWSATPALFMADLHRAGVHLRKPPIYHRVGIPGSGGPDFFRGDTEFIVCASKGKLPWSDNTATGQACKFPVGGSMSYRNIDGVRKNARIGSRVKLQTRRKKSGARQRDGLYVMPDKANPGNVIRDTIDKSEAQELLENASHAGNRSLAEVLSELRRAIAAEKTQDWLVGIAFAIRGSQILQSSVHGGVEVYAKRNGSSGGEGSISSATTQTENGLRAVRQHETTSHTSPRRQPDQQCGDEFNLPLPSVPSGNPQSRTQFGLSRLWETKSYRRSLQEALPQIQAAWRSAVEVYQQSTPNRCARGDLISCTVGGGQMGDSRSHLNEAPYPESLVEPFVLSFCPPDGIVFDGFSGSGTTAAVALRHGRRFVGCDIRENQCELTRRRVAEVQKVFA